MSGHFPASRRRSQRIEGCVETRVVVLELACPSILGHSLAIAFEGDVESSITAVREHRRSFGSCFTWCLLLTSLYVPSCTRDRTDVFFYIHDGYTFSRAEQRAIRTVAQAAARDARLLLPDLPSHLIVRVNPGRKVIDEIGSSSDHSAPNVVHWMVDPSRPGGATGTAHAHLRAALFFHFHRLVRLKYQRDVTLMDHVISLGMATAFERYGGGRTYPWGQYPDNVEAWVAELMAQAPTENPNRWMFRHADGRRWVGIRAGTYLVDRAIRASGKSAAELVSLRSAEVLRLALEQ